MSTNHGKVNKAVNNHYFDDASAADITHLSFNLYGTMHYSFYMCLSFLEIWKKKKKVQKSQQRFKTFMSELRHWFQECWDAGLTSLTLHSILMQMFGNDLMGNMMHVCWYDCPQKSDYSNKIRAAA